MSRMNDFLTKLKEQRQPLVDQILDSLKKDQIPWKQPWISSVPYNASTKRRYTGINRFILTMASMKYGYSDPRWMTFNQATDAGYKIKKKPENFVGNYGIRIECWKLYNSETKKVMNFSDYEKLSDEEKEQLKDVLFWRNYPATVFNAENIDGIEPLNLRKKIHIKDNVYEKIVRTLQENMNLSIDIGHQSQAFYSPHKDTVSIPDPLLFKSIEGYYSTFFHEIAHATGHPARLDRLNNAEFGSEKYAQEELIAEITSMFFGQEVQLPASEEHIENHQAYIQSWINVLNDDPNELYRAIKAADKASDYMVKNGNVEKIMHSQLNRTFEQVLKEIQKDILPKQELRCIRVKI